MLFQTPTMILILLVLTGCSYTLPQYTEAPVTAKAVAIELELVNAQLELVPLGQAFNSKQQMQLHRFIALQGNSYPQRVIIAANEPLITRHQEQLRQLLLNQGVQATNIAFRYSEKSVNSVIIISEYFRAVAPACHQSGYADLGCASSRNLAMMVADPAQLIRGASLAPTDGVKATEAVKRYRYPTEAPKSETLVDLTKVK
ncbi:CpaD family pilus assembly lipoprotein [Colwellia psychrerythraea]|uniref:Pilus biogenesis CpaD-related protein n=1 Tax=Colwellia psychrerythraea TaxID=28229 RepID=A0A099KMR0_COLPS|nr:CpaD family pilus assembly lipoprotein [Colwellia psychrerythraea]KGJ91192.1 Pilus biogenesis CpaD-related protein [Colwellia psychrerythraea]